MNIHEHTNVLHVHEHAACTVSMSRICIHVAVAFFSSVFPNTPISAPLGQYGLLTESLCG